MSEYIFYIAAGLILIMLTGCTSLNISDTTKDLGVQIATLKIIEDADDRQARAAKVYKIATGALELIDSDTVFTPKTLDLMEEKVREAIDWQSLEGSDKLLINALIGQVRLEIEERLIAADIDHDKLVRVKDLLKSIARTAKAEM